MLYRYHNLLHRLLGQTRILLVLNILCMCISCQWREAKEVIVLADSLDVAEHVLYNDTAALGQIICHLDNPLGRVFMPNTLGKAYYYMGRNHSSSNRIGKAADCYIESDRLHIDDPIYRGRINSCMGYICAQNRKDSLAVIFYERANRDFAECNNEWRYAQSLLNLSLRYIYLHQFSKADSLLKVTQTFSLDSSFTARQLETIGLYYYEQKQYDSALVYLNQGLAYWQSEYERCFNYLKIMQSYYFGEKGIHNSIPYAQKIISISNNPNHISNAYYCLMQDAKDKNDIKLLSQYAHARTDAQKIVRDDMAKRVEAITKFEDYLLNPYPLRWIWIVIIGFTILFLLSTVGVLIFRQNSKIANQQLDSLSAHVQYQEARLSEELFHRQFGEKLSEILDKYHTPHKRWREYRTLKKDLNPWLKDWICHLDMLPLSDKEKIFCVLSLIYSHMTDVELADYLCYNREGIRIFKTRILKKIGVSSPEFPKFLRNLTANK